VQGSDGPRPAVGPLRRRLAARQQSAADL